MTPEAKPIQVDASELEAWAAQVRPMLDTNAPLLRDLRGQCERRRDWLVTAVTEIDAAGLMSIKLRPSAAALMAVNCYRPLPK